jgi:hypothetical protein
MAAFLESIDNLVDAIRGQQTNNGYGTQGTPDPSVGTIEKQKPIEIDIEPINVFSRAVSEITPNLDQFNRGLALSAHKIAETIQSFITLQGAVNGLASKIGQNVPPGASGGLPTPLTNANAWWRQPSLGGPGPVPTPAQAASRASRRRRLLRRRRKARRSRTKRE